MITAASGDSNLTQRNRQFWFTGSQKRNRKGPVLGKEKVGERQEYDHVGVKACTIQSDNSRVEEKIGKGRRALNAASGLGIRKSGISMKTCNLIFWTIVMPIITFGCEIWQVNDRDTKICNASKDMQGAGFKDSPRGHRLVLVIMD